MGENTSHTNENVPPTAPITIVAEIPTRSPSHTIYKHAGKETDECGWRIAQRQQKRHLRRRRMKCECCDQRYCYGCDLRADHRDGVAGPQQPKIAVMPKRQVRRIIWRGFR